MSKGDWQKAQLGTIGAVRVDVDGRSVGHFGLNGEVTWADEIFVIGGQSNADGRGVIDGAKSESVPNVLMLDKGGNVGLAAEPLGKQIGGWINNIPDGLFPGVPGHGFSLEMGRQIARNAGFVPMLVPCAIGSTTLQHWQKPANGVIDYSTLFGAMILRAQKVQRHGRQPVFCWFGHESNGTIYLRNLTTGFAYVDGYHMFWQSLVKNVREYFPNAPFLYAQIGAHNNSTEATKLTVAADAQRYSEDDGTTVTSTPVTTDLVPSGTGSTVVGGVVTIDTESALSGVRFSTSLTISQIYVLTFKAVGTGRLKINGGYESPEFREGWWDCTFTATAVNGYIYRFTAEPCHYTITDISLRAISSRNISSTFMVVTHDVLRNAGSDSVHVSAEGQREIGRRMALAYQQHVLKHTDIDGTGPRLVSVTSTDATHTKVKWTQAIAAAKPGETNYGDGTSSLFRVYDGGTEKSVSSVAIDGADPTALIITHASCAGLRAITYGDRAGQDAIQRKGAVYNTSPLPLPAPTFDVVIAV